MPSSLIHLCVIFAFVYFKVIVEFYFPKDKDDILNFDVPDKISKFRDDNFTRNLLTSILARVD